MRPAVEGLVEDVEGFLADASREERPALRGEVRWLDVLPGLLARWRIEDAYDDLVRAWLSIEPVPSARAVVGALREHGTRCYLASNQDVHRARFMSAQLGYHDLLDGELYSCDLGLAKPDPAFFRRVLDDLGMSGREVLVVDDHQGNVDGARTAGLRAERWQHGEGPDVLLEHLARHGLSPSR